MLMFESWLWLDSTFLLMQFLLTVAAVGVSSPQSRPELNPQRQPGPVPAPSHCRRLRSESVVLLSLSPKQLTV